MSGHIEQLFALRICRLLPKRKYPIALDARDARRDERDSRLANRRSGPDSRQIDRRDERGLPLAGRRDERDARLLDRRNRRDSRLVERRAERSPSRRDELNVRRDERDSRRDELNSRDAESRMERDSRSVSRREKRDARQVSRRDDHESRMRIREDARDSRAEERRLDSRNEPELQLESRRDARSAFEREPRRAVRGEEREDRSMNRRADGNARMVDRRRDERAARVGGDEPQTRRQGHEIRSMERLDERSFQQASRRSDQEHRRDSLSVDQSRRNERNSRVDMHRADERREGARIFDQRRRIAVDQRSTGRMELDNLRGQYKTPSQHRIVALDSIKTPMSSAGLSMILVQMVVVAAMIGHAMRKDDLKANKWVVIQFTFTTSQFDSIFVWFLTHPLTHFICIWADSLASSADSSHPLKQRRPKHFNARNGWNGQCLGYMGKCESFRNAHHVASK